MSAGTEELAGLVGGLLMIVAVGLFFMFQFSSLHSEIKELKEDILKAIKDKK